MEENESRYIDIIKSIDVVPFFNKKIGLNYSYAMSPDEKINYLVQNLRLVLNEQKRLDAMTGDRTLDYRQFPFTKEKYNILEDDFREEGKAVVDLLRRLHWEKKEITIEKYDLSSLSKLFKEEQIKLKMMLNKHSVAIVTIENKKYIVDCAYRQFFLSTDDIYTKSFQEAMKYGICMLRDERSRKVAEQILKYGFVEATPENMKIYMDGFVLALANDENIELPTTQEYENNVIGQVFNTNYKVQNEYHLSELWKLYVRRFFPDNSDRTLNFSQENKKTVIEIKNKLQLSEDSFQIVMINEKKYIRTKDGDIEFTLENLKSYLDSILIKAAQNKDDETLVMLEQQDENIVTPSIYEYLKLYPCGEPPKEFPNYIIESEPFIISDENKFGEFNEEMTDEEKLTIIVQKERQYLMNNFDVIHESLQGECEDSSTRVILDCTSKGFKDAMFLSPKRYIGGKNHNCAIASSDKTSYIIDCTYRQFFKETEKEQNCGMYMIADEKRKMVAMQLLKYGFIEATPENIKAYMDGYEMANRKSFEETGISAEEYIRRLAEDENVPIHIVTNREILESDMKMKITSSEIEEVGNLVISLQSKAIENKDSLNL